MARSRNIKPSLFKNEVLGEADPLLIILFQGLWCLADREGRLEDRPKRIKAEVFPYRDIPDINGYLTVLQQLGFIHRYEVENQAYIQVINFTKHQSPHKTEKPSEIPQNPIESGSCTITVKSPLYNDSTHVKESLIPDSLIPDSLERGTPPRPTSSPVKKFVKPSIQEVREYCQEIGASVNPVAFWNHYETVGWKVGKNPMKDWMAAVRGWNARDKQ